MDQLVYTVEELSQLLRCSSKTVEEWARSGKLAGIKPGGGWVFPAGALIQRLNELALEEATARRKPLAPTAVAMAGESLTRRRGNKRQLPQLPDFRPPK